MGSQALLGLPTIDFSEIYKHNRGTLLWDSTKTQVLKALQDYGCFEASFNRFSPDTRKSMFSSLEQLFDLPLETKERNIPDKIYNGYYRQVEEIPIFEGMGIEDPESFSNLIWPHGNSEFSNNIQVYYDELKAINEIVRTMVLESLNLEKYMDEHMELTEYILRVMKYRVPEKDESNLGLQSHVDKNVLTILHHNEVEGLQVKKKDGEWIKMKLSSNSFVVMVGESFRAWTNGRLHAATHKVVMSGDKNRFTFGFFADPKWGKLIKVPEEMVDEEHPLLFKPFEFGEYLKFISRKENIGDKFGLAKYCGISY